MTKTEYREYLASPHWKDRRRVFLESHNSCNRCQVDREFIVCFYDQDIHVHHTNYAHIGAELDIDLEALCPRCHELETFGRTELVSAKELFIKHNEFLVKSANWYYDDDNNLIQPEGSQL